MTVLHAESAADLEQVALEAATDADIVMMAAAVADYRPVAPEPGKRTKSGDRWTIELEPTTDILARLGERRTSGQLVVGFAAEHGPGGAERARAKLERKGADMIVMNDVSRIGYRLRCGLQRADVGHRGWRHARHPPVEAGVCNCNLGCTCAIHSHGCRRITTDTSQEGRTVDAPEVKDEGTSAAIAAAGETARRVIDNVAQVIHAPATLLERCVLALLCEGHIIIEDFPGVGKTMLAKSIARSLDTEFARVQATPDLLPSDITGVSVFNLQGDEFEFKPGPVFANLVLVDEINRASPKTQSALLECMQEAQVTVDGHTHPLARPFMVIATQNPIEYEGTFPLPEAQLDRFTMLLTLGYPGPAEEATMLSEHAAGEPLEALEAVTTAPEIEAAIAAVKQVFVEDSLHRYVVAILRHTRGDARLALGASPRSGISLLRVAKAYAALRGRDYVIPSDIKDVAPDVLSHRVILAAESRTAGVLAADIVLEAVDRTPVPV